MKKILFVCPYPAGRAPSQRFRFEQYISQLQEKGFSAAITPFFGEKAYRALYQSGNLFAKIHAILQSYLRRLSLLLHARSSDFVFIHREATPAGPPLIEWWIAKVLRKKIIFDFDDAIWLTDNTAESALARTLRWRSKVKSICKWSYRVSCGNKYLAEFASQFNSRVTINPTTIDTTLHIPDETRFDGKSSVTIGWTGSHSTLKYLTALLPVLQSLETRYPQMETLVIADRDPRLALKNFRFVPWSKESEVADLRKVDIGIMPLPDDEWTKGKCGFKALQYMALEIPAVASPVGVNTEIIQHGKHGYLASSDAEWFECIEKLILDQDERKRMGQIGRQKVIEHYSVNSNLTTFLSLFQ